MEGDANDLTREELLRELAEARERVRLLERDALVRSLETFAVLADALGLGLCVKDPDADGSITIFNGELSRLTGLPREEALGRREEDVLGKRSAVMGLQSEAASMDSGVPVCAEETLSGPDGPLIVRTVRWSLRDAEGRVCAVLCLVENLTRQMRQLEDCRAMARNMIDIYYRADAQGRLTFATPSAARLLGYDSVDEMLGKNMADTFYLEPSRRELFLGRLAQSGRVDNFEVQLRGKDGRMVLVEANCRAVVDQDGNIVSVEGVARDISKRRSLEGLYRVSEKYYRQLFNNTGTAMAIFGSDAMVKRCNARFEALAGLSRDKIEGRTDLFDFVDERDQDRVRSYHGRRLKSGPDAPPSKYQFRFKTMGRGVRDVLANIAVIPETGERIFSLIDVTELKDLERALTETADRLREAQEVGSVGTWELNIDTGEVHWSEHLHHMLGYHPAQVPSMELFLNSVHPDDVDMLAEVEKQAIAEGLIKEYEFRFFHPEGGIHWAKNRLRAESDPSTGRMRLVGMIMDITQDKLREEQIIRAMRKAEEANRAKTEFLANVSHEIRTPANVITSMLKLLSMGELPQEQLEYVGSANLAVRGLVELLDDLLDLSRIEAGALEIREEAFVFSELLEQVASSFAADTREKKVELNCRLEPDFPEIVVSDQSRLRQILFNLVGNAVKHTRQGEVEVAVALRPDSEPGRSRLSMVVRDTGSGIVSTDLERVFHPFARGSDDIQDKGAGLGLAIVKKLSQLMGGDVGIESEPGRGTTVTVHLLVGTASAAVRPESPEPAEPGRSRPLSVLVVEDDPISRRGLVRLLELYGHTTDMAGDGREALEKLGAGSFDVVLMDVRMPVMDGMESVRRIRAGEAGKDKAGIPVIALTAQAMQGDRDRLVEAGMSDYLPKPLDYDRLLEVLTSINGCPA